jgi:hypothetical protein
MNRLQIKLIVGFYRDEAHRRASDGFGDRLGIVEVILLAFQVRFDKLWRDQSNVMAMLLESTCKVLTAWARLHTDKALRQVRNKLRQLTTIELVAREWPACLVARNKMKRGLAQIDTNGLDRHIARLLDD